MPFGRTHFEPVNCVFALAQRRLQFVDEVFGHGVDTLDLSEYLVEFETRGFFEETDVHVGR